MSANNLSIEDCDSLNISSEILSNKETQTSSTYITDSFDLVKGPSRPLPKGIDKSDIEPSVNALLLDCKVLKDSIESKSAELETESFINDVINTNQNVSIQELGDSHTSQNYCKEVAQPYLKTHLNDCEDETESLERLIQDALEDIPDYQPCFEIYEGKKDIEEKTNVTSASKMDTIPDIMFDEEDKTSDTSFKAKKGTEEIDNQTLPKSAPDNIDIVELDIQSDEQTLPEDTDEANKNKEPNRSISMESISNRIKESFTAIKRSASSCLDTIENVIIGFKKPENTDDKPTYNATEKTKEDVSSSQNVQTETGNSLNSLKNLLNKHSEKIATFKGACKDFAENFINNSNDKLCAMKDTCKDFAENLINNSSDKVCSMKDTCKDFAENLINNNTDKVYSMKDTCKDFAENLINNSNDKLCAMKDTCKDFAENLINNNTDKLCAMKDTCKDFAENLVNNSDEKINTIKKTCNDYTDKFYNTSKEAVTLITSESARILFKPRTGLNSEDDSNEGQPKIKMTKISADSITSFLFNKAENKPVNNDSSTDKAITSVSKITDAIPPAIKIGFNKITEDVVSAKFDKSSKYDKIMPREVEATKPPDKNATPETRMPTVSAIDHTPDPPAPSNVFEIIRSKIFSIFHDETERSNEPAIPENQDDEEEDPFERFMEQ